jgi:2-phosphosulfolactate phosphatase
VHQQNGRTVVIDCFPESVKNYTNEFSIVAIDVIRATTTAVTAVAMGRRCYPVGDLESALALAAEMDQPLMVGEVGGDMPAGFHIPNSPARVAEENDLHRPMILLSTSGTKVISAAKGAVCYAACLRNYTAQAAHLIKHHPQVALIGAGTRGEFREEDQMCCAWIADMLCQAGYSPANEQTGAIVQRWHNAPVDSFLVSNSVAYLRRSGQLHDLNFVLAHIDDLPFVYELQGDEIVIASDHPEVTTSAAGFVDSKEPGPQLNANF